MSLLFVSLITFSLILSTTADQEPQFHKRLTAAERKHFFGTEVVDEVPTYEYMEPQLIDRRRRKRSEDDGLEYVIKAFGEVTHLLLEKNADLLSPGCIVQHVTGNGSNNVYPCSDREVNCFYTGSSSNHSNAWVAATVCGGFHAMIGLPEKTLVVQPVTDQHRSRVRRDTSLSDPHIVYELHRQGSECLHKGDQVDTGEATRARRSTSGRKYVETTVVVDPTSYMFHGSGTEKMVKTVMNIAAQRFLDPSLQSKLYFTLTKIVILEHDENDLTIVPDSGITLNSFSNWQANWNPSSDSNPEHADYVLLITKVDLEHNGNAGNTGLARKGMCGLKTHCSVNEDSGLGTGIVIAHETGHVLGMNHDSDGNACPNYKNIMSSMASSGPDALKWSSCSADALKAFLSSSESSCLNDAPAGTAIKSYESSTKPGTIYSANQQCKLMLGNEAEICEGVTAEGQDVCGAISCRERHDTGVKGCVITATPRMDGTDCGHRKWCIGGRCVAMGAGSPAPINGGWSDWETTYGECSRSCGGGVKVKRRFCNNPEPMYGGQTCPGSSSDAELCNMQECSTTQYQFLAEQCAATDADMIQGRRYHWEPDTNAMGDDSCKVSCITGNSYAKRGISKDGSLCFMDTKSPFTKCVVGECKAFGCDGHMDSGHLYDQCGVCNGQGNTCKKISGTFHGGKAHVFTTFVKIPTGSSGITLTQGNMYCYLSVKVGGKQLFTESSPTMSGTYNIGGVVIKYQSKPERLEITGPVKSEVEAQVYRKYGPPYVGVDPDIYYEYHIPTSVQTTRYLWKTKTGSCSKTCGTGTMIPITTCESSVSGTVDDYNCNIHDKPVEASHPCNTHACPPRWRASQWGQCTKSCGGGQRHRSVDCVEENNNVEKVVTASRCHGLTKPSSTSSCNVNACPGVWKVGDWTACSETCGRGLKTRTVMCYSSASSNTPVADSNCVIGDKPKTQDYCAVKPCRTDISGSSCKDKVDNCFGSYGDAVCTGSYKSWARENCMKSCVVCAERPSDFDPDCKDEVENCHLYQSGFCTSGAYVSWAKTHCKKFCGLCEAGTAAKTTQAPVVSPDCLDTDDCAAYGKGVCTEYASWAKTHCKRFCNHCGASGNPSSTNVCEDSAQCDAYGKSVCERKDFAEKHCRRYCGLCQGCVDQEDNCAGYGSSVCTEYKGWATTHCQKFCGLCNGRKKRDVTDSGAPPMEGVDVKPIVREVDMFTDQLLAIESHGQYDDDDVISGADHVPTQPVCNTVRTDAKGQLDILGKLLPGVTCEQVIALPLDSGVIINVTDAKLNCSEGDELTITDLIDGTKFTLCNTALLLSENLVAVKFTPAVRGHGFAYTYESYHRNKTIPACSHVYTDVVGDIAPVVYPQGAKDEGDQCEVYIVGTPGKSIELTFNVFDMTTQDQDSCLHIKDIDTDEEETFCGHLSPFIWESRGSNVKLVYEQISKSDAFAASYSIKDI